MRTLTLLLTLLMTAGCSGCVSVPSHDSLRASAHRIDFGGACGATAVSATEAITAAHCLGKLPGTLDGIPVVLTQTRMLAGDVVRITFDRPTFKTWARIGPRPLEGDRVRYWGQPGGWEMVYREGYVIRGWTTQTLVDANGWFGDSGSGIFDDEGRLVAVMSAISILTHAQSGARFRVMVVVPLQ